MEELDVWYEPDSSDVLEDTCEKKRRKDLEMVHKNNKPISIYNIDDKIDFCEYTGTLRKAKSPKSSSYKVAPSDGEVEERCELIKSTYDVISKYTRAMFDKQNETVVWTMCLFLFSVYYTSIGGSV